MRKYKEGEIQEQQNNIEEQNVNTIEQANPEQEYKKEDSKYNHLAEFVTVRVIKNSKHLKAGQEYNVGKETAISLLQRKFVELI